MGIVEIGMVILVIAGIATRSLWKFISSCLMAAVILFSWYVLLPIALPVGMILIFIAFIVGALILLTGFKR